MPYYSHLWWVCLSLFKDLKKKKMYETALNVNMFYTLQLSRSPYGTEGPQINQGWSQSLYDPYKEKKEKKVF